MRNFTLGPARREPIPGCPGLYVRIDDDIRKTVLFFGFEDKSPGKGGIDCVGTGFLLNYEDCGYIVTAKHLAHGLGNSPFLLRLNRKNGVAENLDADGVRWYEHPDPLVDVAVMPLTIGGGPTSAYDVLYLPQDMMWTDRIVGRQRIGALGVGDFTYTVGLFRLMSGERRNLPIVHFGSVAMMPGDERIPVRDWRDKSKKMMVEGYLVETQAMQGLSGSPVFVRPTTTFDLRPDLTPEMRQKAFSKAPPDFFQGVAPVKRLSLLGLWSGSWDAPPDEVLAVQAGKQRVPVGIGIVVSAQKIEETLQHEELIEMRNQIKAIREARAAEDAATTDSALPMANLNDDTASEVADDANPNHLRDFKRLVDVAARKRPQDD